jgi:hypothetical protein
VFFRLHHESTRRCKRALMQLHNQFATAMPFFKGGQEIISRYPHQLISILQPFSAESSQYRWNCDHKETGPNGHPSLEKDRECPDSVPGYMPGNSSDLRQAISQYSAGIFCRCTPHLPQRLFLNLIRSVLGFQ